MADIPSSRILQDSDTTFSIETTDFCANNNALLSNPCNTIGLLIFPGILVGFGISLLVSDYPLSPSYFYPEVIPFYAASRCYGFIALFFFATDRDIRSKVRVNIYTFTKGADTFEHTVWIQKKYAISTHQPTTITTPLSKLYDSRAINPESQTGLRRWSYLRRYGEKCIVTANIPYRTILFFVSNDKEDANLVLTKIRRFIGLSLIGGHTSAI